MKESPLHPRAAALLEVERARQEPDAAVADRIFERLTRTLSTPSGADGGPPPPPEAGGTGRSLSSIATSKALVGVALAFGIGVGVGALGHSRLARAPIGATQIATSSSVPVAPSVSVVRAEAPRETSSNDETAIDVSALPQAPRALTGSAHAPSHATRRDHDVALAGERALVERARMALAKNASDEALAAIDAHAREFPNGRLTEEREALAVQALAAAGRRSEADERARRFRQQYPSSVFMALVETATRH